MNDATSADILVSLRPLIAIWTNQLITLALEPIYTKKIKDVHYAKYIPSFFQAIP